MPFGTGRNIMITTLGTFDGAGMRIGEPNFFSYGVSGKRKKGLAEFG